jgi:peptidoglycan/xylan/chitin deacetylase (PgdA/CDA1 family)
MRTLAIGTAGCAAAWSLPALAPVMPSLCRALGVPRRLADGDGVVALTFDDGPHPSGTPAVLDALASAGAPATFFLVGEQVERRPALAGEIAAAGHGIGLHGHRHRNLLRVPPHTLREDLSRARDLIGEATGRAPVLYRPPYGIFSSAALRVVRRAGLAPLLWSRWGRDWTRRATPESIAGKLTDGLTERDVLLLHDADFYSADDCWRATVAALPAVLDEIARRGLRPVVAEPHSRLSL